MFYIGGRGCVLCQFIELVTFERCAFIFALRKIALSGYLDTRRNILEHLRNDGRPEIYIYIYKYIAKFRAIERTRKLASLTIKFIHASIVKYMIMNLSCVCRPYYIITASMIKIYICCDNGIILIHITQMYSQFIDINVIYLNTCTCIYMNTCTCVLSNI